MSILEYDNTNKSLNNIYVDIPNYNNRLRQRRSLDYGRSGFVLAGPNRQKSLNTTTSHHHSIPSSPSHSSAHFLSSSSMPKSQIRRQSSERCLIKRHSVDSNKSNISDPGFPLANNKNYAGSNFLIPSQQRSPKDSSSPRSYHSSAGSVTTGRQASYASISILSRQSSINSSNLIGKQQSNDNLNNRKWFSSSSVILTRVKSMKDKFRRVVVQSVQPDDWPPPSILFSERYRYPSSSSCQSTNTSTTSKSGQLLNREPTHLVKSKSIDQSSFPSNYSNSVIINNRKSIRNTNSACSNRQFKRGKLQRSNTSYSSTNDTMEHINNNNDTGIVCTDLDLKAIINNFKREETSSTMNNNSNSNIINNNNNSIQDKLKLTANISKTPTATSSVMGPGFGKRKLMRKQVSFDDEQGVMMINRKVSAIAEEIEFHAPFEYERRSNPTIGQSEHPDNKSIDTFPNDKPFITEITKEDEDENSAPEDADSLALLPILPKEIEFDEFGQTWEIYGADPDPEILGQAIQTHLERLMICRQSITLANGNANMGKSKNDENNNNNNTNTNSGSSGNRGKIEIPKRILKPLRVDLESSENHLRLLARRLCGKWSCFSDDQQQACSSGFAGIHQKIIVSVDHES